MLNEVLNKIDISSIFILSNRLNDTGKIEQGQVRNVGALDRQADYVLAESELLLGLERKSLFRAYQGVIDEVGRGNGRVENGQLSATQSRFYFVRVGDGSAKGYLADVVERLSSTISNMAGLVTIA